jgi:hypothetical protein
MSMLSGLFGVGGMRVGSSCLALSERQDAIHFVRDENVPANGNTRITLPREALKRAC